MDLVYKIQKTIEYIENHLSDEITLDELASQIFCSKFHYHRIFQSMVGEPTIEYVRNRRLSTATKMLKENDNKIADIALECGYNSQASLTKAFKKTYGISPGELRRCRKAVTLYEKVCLIGREFDKTHHGMTLGPKIVEQGEIKLVGIEYTTNQSYIKTHIVNDLFQEMFSIISKVRNKINPNIRIGNCYYDSKQDKLIYLACTEVSDISDIPTGMISKIIPPYTSAVFTHKGLFEKNIHSFGYIYGTWFPNSGYELNTDISLVEKFEPHFKENKEVMIEMSFAIK